MGRARPDPCSFGLVAAKFNLKAIRTTARYAGGSMLLVFAGITDNLERNVECEGVESK